MIILAISVMLVSGATMPSAYAQNDVCQAIDGAMLINKDDEYIGKLAISTDPDSVFNEYGKYGNEYNSWSIWNEYGKNGGEYQSGSAFNDYSSDPPRIVKNGSVIGFLTTNKFKRGAVNPIVVGVVCYEFKPPR